MSEPRCPASCVTVEARGLFFETVHWLCGRSDPHGSGVDAVHEWVIDRG